MCHHKAPHRPWQPRPKYKDLFADETIPEPDNLFDHYEGRARAVAAVTMKVGEDMNKPTSSSPFPPDSRATRCANGPISSSSRITCAASRAWTTTSAACSIIWTPRTWLHNTIVIYTSDQGFFLGDHGWFDKRLMYEESLRMPFLMRYPGAIRPGTVNRDMVLNIDFAPMFLDYAGVQRAAPKCKAAASAPTWKATRRATGASPCTTATGCTTPAITTCRRITACAPTAGS